MSFLGFINITTISIALMIIGSIGMILVKKPLDKVILFSIVDAGFFPETQYYTFVIDSPEFGII